MEKIADPGLQGQDKVNAYFDTQSSFWKNIYSGTNVYAEIHRDRHATVLNWIVELGLPADSQVLEVGCGAGNLALALAQRGLRVHAVDSSEAMVEQARQLAATSDAGDRLSVGPASIYELPFDDNSMDLVIAIGVIPWIEHPNSAMHEMARVTKPGGYIVFTADNRARLNNLLDPWLNPLVAKYKRKLRRQLERSGLRKPPKEIDSSLHGQRFVNDMLKSAKLKKVRHKTLGFGPFTFFRLKLLPDRSGIALHKRLQRLADANKPVLRGTGSHHIVIAKKPLP